MNDAIILSENFKDDEKLPSKFLPLLLSKLSTLHSGWKHEASYAKDAYRLKYFARACILQINLNKEHNFLNQI